MKLQSYADFTAWQYIFIVLLMKIKVIETPAKLVDMDTVQGVVAQKNEDITIS